MDDGARTAAAHRTLSADVVVVGARVAGAAAATHLARAGHDVLVLDRAEFPSDTISTHVIARSGMVQLARLGVVEALVAGGAPPLRRVELTSHVGTVSKDIRDRLGISFLLAPRRYALDAALQQAALAAGARLRQGCSVEGVIRDSTDRVVGVRAHDGDGPVDVLARHVVGADGLSSRIARSVRAALTIVEPSSGACQYAYVTGSWDAIEYHLVDGVFAGVFPTHDGAACVWAITPEEVARRYRHAGRGADEAFVNLLLDRVPELAARVASGSGTTPVRGMLRMPNHFREACGPGWSLVGDAGYHRDAITGHGISDALWAAELLAEAVDTGLRCPALETVAMAEYAANRDRLAARIFQITVALAAFPDRDTFVGLQRELALEIDVLADELHHRPQPCRREAPALERQPAVSLSLT
ncbi:FAD-dependent monooxygenase [Intrasporangium sp. DVR]|uniref:NAD(P)/FAD-dependent oxidoreductase n=1 Tax=Intrasporangium sp. DVR TaxID=3127867 RepID=UPI00333E5453